MTKKTRKDVSEKLKARKDFEEFVVKASLNKYINSNNKKTQLLQAIENRLQAFSKCIVYLSRALMTLLKERFCLYQDVCDVPIPDVFNLTFLRQLMLGMEGCHKNTRDKDVEEFIKLYPNLLCIPKRFIKDSNIYTYGVKKYVTNLKNALVTNLEPLLKRYLKGFVKREELNRYEYVYCLFKIMGWSNIPKDCEGNIVHRELIDKLIEEQRKILGLLDGDSITTSWFKKTESLNAILRHRVFLNRSLNFKPFNVIPLTKIRLNFITIDCDVLEGILKDINDLGDVENPDIMELWKVYFKVDIFKTTQKKFTGLIETDGTSICIHLRRPKRTPKTSEEIAQQQKDIKEKFKATNVRKLACDPGRTNIYTIVEDVWDTEKNRFVVKKHEFTRKEYYEMSGANKARRMTYNWTKELRESLRKLSIATSKGVDVENHKKYLDVFHNEFQTLWKEYTKPRWSQQRLRLYGGKKRSLDNFWNKVLGPKKDRGETVIAYGSASFAPGGKGEQNVPIKYALKACMMQEDLKVLFVDEFRTSKICYKTGKLLKLVQANGKSLRGLLWCDSTIQKSSNSKQGTFINRDVNAAMNILVCAKEDSRPSVLDRKKSKGCLPKQTIGKVLC